MARFRVVERQFEAFLRTPLSVRKAMGVIVSATVVSVLLGGVLITHNHPHEIENVGDGMWWALQTVTTVGYGDVVPTNAAGRVIGAVIMLESIAFVSIVTEAITSSFVERARRQAAEAAMAAEAAGASRPSAYEPLTTQLADITARLDQIQRSLGIDGPPRARDDELP
jgi:voltage-gated potassium channel Kch